MYGGSICDDAPDYWDEFQEAARERKEALDLLGRRTTECDAYQAQVIRLERERGTWREMALGFARALDPYVYTEDRLARDFEAKMQCRCHRGGPGKVCALHANLAPELGGASLSGKAPDEA